MLLPDGGLDSCASEKEEKHKLIVCGKKGVELCRAKGMEVTAFDMPDMPSRADAGRLYELIAAEHPKYGTVKLVYRTFKNVMTQTPTVSQLLPADSESDAEDVLFFPSREEAESSIALTCLKARLYGVMIEVQTGVQAATLMTMRNAADTAEEEAIKTETALNRIRQNELTTNVLESASGAAGNLYS